MHNDQDPVDVALNYLRSTARAPFIPDAKLEEKLMRSFDNNSTSSRLAKYRTLLIASAVTMLGGAGFAAAGGADVVKSWFVTVELTGEDGQVFIAVLEPVEGKDGTATMDLDLGNGQQASVGIWRLTGLTVDDPLSELGEDATMINVTLNGEASAEGDGLARTITLIQADGAGPASMIIDRLAPGSERIAAGGADAETRTVKLSFSATPGSGETEASVDLAGAMRSFTARARADRTIVAQISEPDEVFDWTDDNDVARELSIVRNDVDDPAGDGFRIYTTLDDGSFMEVGAINSDKADQLEIVDFVVRDGATGVITFVDGDDHGIILEMVGLDGSDVDRNIKIERSSAASKTPQRIKAEGQRE